MKRSRRKEPEGLPPEAATLTVAAAPAPKVKIKKVAASRTDLPSDAGTPRATGAPLPPAPPAVPPGAADQCGKAQRALNSAEDAIADALESGADTKAAMESLDIAKDFFKGGDYAEAAQYATEAESSVKAAGGEPSAEKPKPDVGKLACPSCGEELSPEWGACPVCGHRTR
jgi:hypothetical protein